MDKPGEKAWMRGGAALFLAASALCYALRRRLPGRIALGFALACLEDIREARLAGSVHKVLARAGRPE